MERVVVKKKPSNTPSISIRIFLLCALFIIFCPAPDLYAATFPSLKNAPIEVLEQAAQDCPERKRAKFALSIHPPAYKLLPNQKVLISWWINNQNDERWPYPVYLREENKPGGKEVSPIWMYSIKSSDLPEGLNTYYLTTYCGVARIEIAKAPRPVITSYPFSVMSGDTIRITGRFFNEWNPKYLREVRINEQGGTRTLKIEEWTDTEITATLPGGLYPGRQKIYVASGTTKSRQRHSKELPIIVVNKESIPSITMASMLEEIFSRMDIHLNNYGPQRSGSRFIENDAYISFTGGDDAERFHLSIPEYNLSLKPSPKIPVEAQAGVAVDLEPKISPYSYYINNINMDKVTVSKSNDGWSMTFFFEMIDDELIGADTENMDIRAFVPEKERPLNIQIDDLKIVVDFNLLAINGDMVVAQKKIESFGNIRGPGSGCVFNDVDICKELTDVYEKELLGQLSEIMEFALGARSTRALFTKAIEPWLANYSMGELIQISLEENNVIIDYLLR